MNHTATVSFTETEVDTPAGITPAGYSAQLFLADMPSGPALAVTAGAPFTFPITLPGTYHVTVARVSTEGTNVAAPIASAPFIVTPDIVKMNVPLAVTVTLA